MVVSVVFFCCSVGWFLGVCGVGVGVFVFVVVSFFVCLFVLNLARFLYRIFFRLILEN